MSDIRHTIESLTLDELRALAHKLNVPSYRQLKKAELTDRLLECDPKALLKGLGHESWWKHNAVGVFGILVTILLGVPALWPIFAGDAIPSKSVSHIETVLSRPQDDSPDSKSWLQEHYLTFDTNPFLWVAVVSFAISIVSITHPASSKMFLRLRTSPWILGMTEKIILKKYPPERTAREIVSNWKSGSNAVYVGRWIPVSGWTGVVHDLPERRDGLWQVTVFERSDFFNTMNSAYTYDNDAADLRKGDCVVVNGRISSVNNLWIDVRPAWISKTPSDT